MSAFVNSAHIASSNTIAYTPTAGNALIVTVGDFIATGTPVASLTDDDANVYSVGMATTAGGASSYELSSFYLLNCPAGITTLTISWSGGTTSGTKALEILVLEYSGLGSYIGSAALNYDPAPGNGADVINSNAINITQQPATLLGLIFNPTQNTCIPGSNPIPFASRYAVAGSGMFAEDTHLVTTGNAAATATTITGSNNFLVAAMAFADALPPIPPQPVLARRRQFFVEDTVVLVP